MAHLGNDFTSFETFLNGAEAFYAVDFAALNSSGVTGTAILAIYPENEDGAQYLNVSIAVTGMEAEAPVPQHIHGLFDADGNPADSTTPDINSDADLDGMVEVLEGLASYGDIILPLSVDGALPMTDANGTHVYIQNFDLNDGENFFSPVSDTDYEGADLLPLDLREVVLHGVAVPAGIGAGTEGEVNGDQDGFVPILPAAAGEITEVTLDEALAILDTQRATAATEATLDDDGDRFDGGLGDDSATGGDGDDRLEGGTGNDDLSGGDGDDAILGQAGNDMLSGDGGSDTIAASDGNDTVSGGDDDDAIGGGLGDDMLMGDDGDDAIGGGAGDDMASGGSGDDIVNGGAGDDMLTGDDGADSIGGGDGDDMVMGGAGDDSLGGGAGSDTVEGGDGNDAIGAGDGDDLVSGGAGDDFAAGGAGNDRIMGDDGDDRLNGGAGDDTMTGGEGADVFVFNAITDGETDVITDFETGTDMLTLRGVTAAEATISDVSIGGQAATLVEAGGHSILLEGVIASAVSDTDLLFA